MALPLARWADRGAPQVVLIACILVWSVMAALPEDWPRAFWLSPSRVSGVAFGEAGAVPASHALIARKIRPKNPGDGNRDLLHGPSDRSDARIRGGRSHRRHARM